MHLQLSQDCINKWRLEELDQFIVEFNNYVADAINNSKIEFKTDYTNIVINIAGKSLLVMREILFLAAAGYPDGALSLSRNLYEQFIILAFFESEKAHKEFPSLIINYFLDYKKRTQHDYKYEFQLNNENALSEDTKNDSDDIIKSTHSKQRGDYWWTGQTSFRKLIEHVMSNVMDEYYAGFLSELHISYKRACTSLHASCRGNIIRLKEDFQPHMVDILPTYEAQCFPLWFATSTLIFIFGVTCKTLEISHDPYLGKLNELALFYKNYNTRSKKND